MSDADDASAYRRISQRDHILLRPDTYVGSLDAQKQWHWVLSNERFVYREVNVVPALLKIFDEVIVNASDHKIRDPSMATINVDIDNETGQISVFNDGAGIPVAMHAEEGILVPELIFGHLLTSSNYDSNGLKIIGGRNGYGAKLSNIFSTQFTVETYDGKRGLFFKQNFSDNMSVMEPPEVVSGPHELGPHTRITFTPDYKRLGMSGLDETAISLMHRRLYDIAATTLGVEVNFNKSRVPIYSFRGYCEKFCPHGRENDEVFSTSPDASSTSSGLFSISPVLAYAKIGKRWEVAVMRSFHDKFQSMSFVNGIHTRKGGNHVKHVVDQIVEHFLQKIDPKEAHLTGNKIKHQLFVVVNARINDPSFDSQTKETLLTRPQDFGSTGVLPRNFLKAVSSSEILKDLKVTVAQQEARKMRKEMKRSDGIKKKHVRVPRLDDATLAGTIHSKKCTLLLTEGDSAKSFAVSGMGVAGREHFGVYALRGKVMNPLTCSQSRVAANDVLHGLKMALGLKDGVQYSGRRLDSLRYGRVVIMADQDLDGSHVKGLVMNLFYSLWPDLVQVPGFFAQFRTPIIRARRRDKVLSFYTLDSFKSWRTRQDSLHGWNIKYYKGLGTSSASEAKEYFSNLDDHIIPFSCPQGENQARAFEVAFGKSNESRRMYMDQIFDRITYKGTQEVVQCKDGVFDKSDVDGEKLTLVPSLDLAVLGSSSLKKGAGVSFAKFVHTELAAYWAADCLRSIPSAIDGLKPSQRKALYACFKKNLQNSEMKVAQLSGFVGETTAYHHGEASLMGTIVKMAQDYVGYQNINLLQPSGQFGTRIQGGKDAASARYIFTGLSPIARAIFPASDDAILPRVEEDGVIVEPTFYQPIIPLVLLQGVSGIGSGYSCFIPCYHPLDVMDNVARWLRDEPLQDMKPWYRGIQGRLSESRSGSYVSYGKWSVESLSNGATNAVHEHEQVEDTPDAILRVHVSDLPIGTWTETFKTNLDKLADAPKPLLRDYVDASSESHVNFTINLTREGANMLCCDSNKKPLGYCACRADLSKWANHSSPTPGGPGEDPRANELQCSFSRKFMLSSTMTRPRIVLFDAHGRIASYHDAKDVVRKFCESRKETYDKRKSHQLQVLRERIRHLEIRKCVIDAVVNDDLRLHKLSHKESLHVLQATDFGESVGYLTEKEAALILDQLTLSDITRDKITSLEKTIDLERVFMNTLEGKSTRELWEEDLAKLREVYKETQEQWCVKYGVSPSDPRSGLFLPPPAGSEPSHPSNSNNSNNSTLSLARLPYSQIPTVIPAGNVSPHLHSRPALAFQSPQTPRAPFGTLSTPSSSLAGLVGPCVRQPTASSTAPTLQAFLSPRSLPSPRSHANECMRPPGLSQGREPLPPSSTRPNPASKHFNTSTPTCLPAAASTNTASRIRSMSNASGAHALQEGSARVLQFAKSVMRRVPL